MKFRFGNWRIDSKSLVRIHWKKYYPKLVVHEKFEKHVKWIMRILTAIGIITSFLILPYWAGIVITLLLFGIEQLFEHTIFEYSIMALQPFPDFDIEYDQWLTNGYFLLNPEIDDHEGYLNYFGPAYADKGYAIKFFNYIRSWNQNKDVDEENNICISFIIESDVSYSTYLYANTERKWLDPMFANYKESMKLEKYGKQQQELILQMVFWKNLKMKEGMFFHKFRNQQKSNEPFYFAPFVAETSQPIEELKVWKTHFKIKGRSELTPSEIEYHHK
ncbi:hypothetical protein DSM03_101516 [Leeuwenhoekiella aestuarii]|uniref:Uncharacterized protein n=1 Tax=Leeuwenhoekiella aestuarii TaxID=2249426 RepID=A0A4Q0NYD7_9FLAO|nr:hypothetical protein [Leeuwenhoekiella aestuarii]RXG17817.1 hypothetical protein DSM04_1011 [Leeuwenhoekiella aestuarii]RXG19146.1 hypothetical protein DSM03_101516 [Leeuwenhoekiella aestuarii]